ncbi:unnamed protein product [Adineta steineri]|uniref:Uncharacterized protein n=1 Tax=Adineta steineri TaxID=433720 RepID=A0A814N8F2_9BILA|nr:unnamed protein product [Adineta steineri]CAF1144447.1 unnamed protein product [Adineta steineri]
MQFILWSIFIIILNLTKTNQVILRSSFKPKNSNSLSIKNNSYETYCSWFLYPPWKRRNDLFNDKLYNNSVEYFSINENDYITNNSYIESSKIIACNEINLTFYSKINSFNKNITLNLFLYKQNLWNNIWKYMYNDSQWKFHHLKIDLTNETEHIQFRFAPLVYSNFKISMDITKPNINCQNNTSEIKSQVSVRGNSKEHSFLFALFGGIFLLICIIITVIFIYGIIEKRINVWTRRASSKRRRKLRKTRNAIRDESTVISLPANMD